MALPLLTRITHGLIIGIGNKRQLVVPKDLMYDRTLWVTKTIVPSRRGTLVAPNIYLDDGEDSKG
jgi:hypothetical protein